MDDFRHWTCGRAGAAAGAGGRKMEGEGLERALRMGHAWKRYRRSDGARSLHFMF